MPDSRTAAAAAPQSVAHLCYTLLPFNQIKVYISYKLISQNKSHIHFMLMLIGYP